MTPQSHAFAQMQKIAEPIICAYHNDLNEHDKRTIDASEPGCSFLWAPRECGTHLIALTRPTGSNSAAVDHFKAVMSGDSKTAWHLVSIHKEGAIVRQLESDEAWDLVQVTDRLASSEPKFYALHM